MLNLLLQSTVRPKSCQTLSNGTFWANGGLLSQTRPLICKVYFRRHALHISWIMKNQENEYIEIRLEFVLLNSLVVAKLPGKGSRVQIPTNSWYFFNQIIGFYFFITDVPFYVLLQRQLPKTLKNGWKKSKKQLLARGSNPRHLTYSKIGVWRLRKKSTVMTSRSTIGVSVTRLAKINCKIRHPRHFLRLFARIYFKTFWTFATTKHFNSASSRLPHLWELLAKFHQNWTKIVDFSLIANFEASLIFYASVFRSTLFSLEKSSSWEGVMEK